MRDLTFRMMRGRMATANANGISLIFHVPTLQYFAPRGAPTVLALET